MNLESLYQLLKANLKSALELSALILGIVNGLILLKFYLRDKPKLKVEPVHPDVYQWWFRLPPSEYEGQPTRRYGFIAYVDVVNKGLRKVSLDSWRLFVKSRDKTAELRPRNMPEVAVPIGGHVKIYSNLGQKGLVSEGTTAVNSGGAVSGMVYYVYECYGDETWDPRIENGKIEGKIIVKDVFGKKASCKFIFSEKPLDDITKMAKGIVEME